MPPALAALIRRLSLWNRRRLHLRQQRRQLGYRQWIERHDVLDQAAQAALRARLRALPSRPTVAVVVPTAQAAAMKARMAEQIYPDWTVLGCDDPAQALRAASAPWLLWADDGDRLRPHTLLLLVEAALQSAAPVLVYADEDRIDAVGARSAPQFKCDWNPPLLLGTDAVGRPALWQREHLLLRCAAGWRSRHELALRATVGLEAAQVQHVPHILLHRLADADPPDVAAVQALLDEQRLPAEAWLEGGGAQIRARPLARPPATTIIIPTRNGLDLLRPCVDSICERTTGADYDIVIVDNGSDDPATLRWLERAAGRPRIAVRRDDRPFNYSALNNAAVAAARGELVALVNNDIEVISPNWLHEMAALALWPGTGAVGARLWYGNRSLQHAGVTLGIGGTAGHSHRHFAPGDVGWPARASLLHAVSAVTAACLVVRRDLYMQVQGLDEHDFAVAFNDVDFCLKLVRAGRRNLWTPQADLFHHESVSRGRDRQARNVGRFLREREAFVRRWGDVLARDPAWNPNLTLEREDGGLASPPAVSYAVPWWQQPGAGAAVSGPG